MIVLTSGKDASSAYCLTTALYCPLPGQYLAIARHKTIRRERKSPLSFLLFTLHQIVWNPDKHRGSERWRVGSTLHHPSPTLHLRIAHGIETEAWPVRSGAETTFLCPTDFTDLHRFFRVKGGWRVVKRRAHSSPHQSNLYTTTYATSVKGEEYFWNWRIIVTSYSEICVNLCKSVKSVGHKKVKSVGHKRVKSVGHKRVKSVGHKK